MLNWKHDKIDDTNSILEGAYTIVAAIGGEMFCPSSQIAKGSNHKYVILDLKLSH